MIFRWLRRLFTAPSDVVPATYVRPSPDVCTHPSWTSPYDYNTYPGAVQIVESHCTVCGVRAQGSCQ